MTPHGDLTDQSVAETHAKSLRKQGFEGVKVFPIASLGRVMWRIESNGQSADQLRERRRMRVLNDVEEGARG